MCYLRHVHARTLTECSSQLVAIRSASKSRGIGTHIQCSPTMAIIIPDNSADTCGNLDKEIDDLMDEYQDMSAVEEGTGAIDERLAELGSKWLQNDKKHVELSEMERNIETAATEGEFDIRSSLGQKFNRDQGKNPTYKGLKSHKDKRGFRQRWANAIVRDNSQNKAQENEPHARAAKKGDLHELQKNMGSRGSGQKRL